MGQDLTSWSGTTPTMTSQTKKSVLKPWRQRLVAEGRIFGPSISYGANYILGRRVDSLLGISFCIPSVVNDVKGLIQLLESGSPLRPSNFIVAIFSLVASLCDSCFYLFDNATWLASIGVLDLGPDRQKRW